MLLFMKLSINYLWLLGEIRMYVQVIYSTDLQPSLITTFILCPWELAYETSSFDTPE